MAYLKFEKSCRHCTTGGREAVDKTLQSLIRDGELQRIDRGLFDRPTVSSLSERPTSPDYRAVVEAIAP
jgi:hypothetical protein